MSRPAVQLELSGRPTAIRWVRELGDDGRTRHVCQRCGHVFAGLGEPVHPCRPCSLAEFEVRRAERRTRDAEARAARATQLDLALARLPVRRGAMSTAYAEAQEWAGETPKEP